MHTGTLEALLVAGMLWEDDRHGPHPLAVGVLIVRGRVVHAAKTVGVDLSEPGKVVPSEVMSRVAHGVS